MPYRPPQCNASRRFFSDTFHGERSSSACQSGRFCQRSCSSSYLEKLQVDVWKPTCPQLHLKGCQRSQKLQGNDRAKPRTHCSHALWSLQLTHPQAPDCSCINILVLPPARAEIQDKKGRVLRNPPALSPNCYLQEGFMERLVLNN